MMIRIAFLLPVIRLSYFTTIRIRISTCFPYHTQRKSSCRSAGKNFAQQKSRNDAAHSSSIDNDISQIMLKLLCKRLYIGINVGTRLCGWCSQDVHGDKSRTCFVSMPHAALLVVQLLGGILYEEQF
ncbi:hypothetical protein [Selenomonas sp. oral taxon 136]|uniref:hypothetical protein n=1 Tax=Selenomonas sp. oral taxon 136 TaxID=713030 RepID=UPI003FA7EE38